MTTTFKDLKLSQLFTTGDGEFGLIKLRNNLVRVTENGIIASVKDTPVMLRVADNVRIEYERSAIATVKKTTDKIEETTDKA